jgi:UDP-GlcNAc:undecaprenyl-phosphate/decaprenyl-phosphate GlcNAc-1-phosphate transferase
MFEISSNPLILGIIAFVVSVAATYLVREGAHKFGFVAKPKADRWHKRPTAMMGGVAIFAVTVLVSLFFVPQTRDTFIVLGASSLLFLVGLLDDILNIKPYQKLIGQIIGTSVIISFGLIMPWTDSQLINTAITVFWLIGITNAINLLDNMDGLAAGISAIAAFSIALGFMSGDNINSLLIIAVFIGSLIGFLIFNFNPASIFMGDCGSMFVGFFLASSIMLNNSGGRSRGVMSVLAVPVLILFIPIFDTTFVTILRKLWGRKASEGGRDHTSHRLVALGLSERSAVLMIYAFALIAGVIALLVRELETTQSLALITVFSLLLGIVGVYLGKVKVYEEQDEEIVSGNKVAFGFLYEITHKRRIFEVVLDIFLITLSYYAAYVLLFGEFEGTRDWSLFLKSLPILIVLNLAAFLVAGVYRGIWRYTSLRDLFTFGKGVVLGTVLTILALLLLYRFYEYSRAVFVLHSLLLFSAVGASRLAFRVFRQLLPAGNLSGGRITLIYGAGDGGELVLRELRNNPDWDFTPVGFLDDDPGKQGKIINGMKVFGGSENLESVCRENGVQELLLSFRDIPKERLRDLRDECENANVSLKRAWLTIESFDDF